MLGSHKTRFVEEGISVRQTEDARVNGECSSLSSIILEST